jgi:L-aspartate oxidase
VFDSADSLEMQIADTLDAGLELSDPVTTRYVAEHAREALDWLADQRSNALNAKAWPHTGGYASA